MDLATFRELLTPAGQAALADAAALAPTEAGFLACFEKLRKRLPAGAREGRARNRAAAGEGRERSSRHADRMYFTREALEQATGDAVARHRAARFAPFGVVADLCCGIGGDALALAAAGLTVHAVECDPLRAGDGRGERGRAGPGGSRPFHEARRADRAAARCARRVRRPGAGADGRRYLDPEDYTPPLSAIRGRFPPDFPLAVKIAPGRGVGRRRGSRRGGGVRLGRGRVEGVRAVVRAAADRRAAGDRAARRRDALRRTTRRRCRPSRRPGEYVFDPDPAVVRAGLAGLLAAATRALARSITTVALLHGPSRGRLAIRDGYRVELAERFHVRRLRDYLRDARRRARDDRETRLGDRRGRAGAEAEARRDGTPRRDPDAGRRRAVVVIVGERVVRR